MMKPSVTQLLDLLAKPALIDWANRQGLDGIDIKKQRKEALAKGSSLHKQIENYCNGIDGAFESEENRRSFDRFKRGKEFVSIEKKIETEWFVGRYDVKMNVFGETYICDYKSGFGNRIYLENKLQLVAYTMAENSRMAIVSIPDFRFIHVDIDDRQPYEEMLKALFAVWIAKKEIGE